MSLMEAEKAIRIHILSGILSEAEDFAVLKEALPDMPYLVWAENVDRVWDMVQDEPTAGVDWVHEAMGEFRASGERTSIPCEYSRHFEAESRGCALDGGWVGWTYWYGGGKHAEPQAIDWLSCAYWLDVQEEEKVVTVRTFSKRAT